MLSVPTFEQCGKDAREIFVQPTAPSALWPRIDPLVVRTQTPGATRNDHKLWLIA